MNRRRLLYGSGLGLAALAGCLDDTETDATAGGGTERDGNAEAAAAVDDGNESAAEDGEVAEDEAAPEAARETGRDLLEATLAGDTETALEYVPADHFDWVDDQEWTELVDRSPAVEAVHAITFENGTADEEFVADLEAEDEFEAAITAAYVLEYEVDVESDGERIDRPARVVALEIDGEWYGWPQQFTTQRATPQAGVSIDHSDETTATVTLVSKPNDVVVTVRGGDINDPADYQFEAVGDSLTLETNDVGSGQFSVVAHYADDEDHAAVVASFTLLDPAAWEDVSEITLEARLPDWVGVEPAHIEGVENPTLVLREGREYTLAIENGDGAVHNLQLRDENDELVEDYETEFVEDGERAELTVTATSELATYTCAPHQTVLRGEIEVADSFDDEFDGDEE